MHIREKYPGARNNEATENWNGKWVGSPVFASMVGGEHWLQSKSLVLKGTRRMRDENATPAG